MKNEIALLELFSGIGGFTEGFKRAGFTVTKHYFSEVDKHAIANYKYNYPNAIELGSVTNVSEWQIERPKIITFGSPCQDFSLAGKGLGLDGNKSSLIKYAIMAIKRFRPDVFIWENVKGAFSTNAGADYWAIIQAFTNINGYRLEQQLVNTSWVLPQNRERIYIVGHLTGRSEPRVFPFGEELERIDEGLPKAAVVRAITAGGHSGGHHSGMTLLRWQNKNDGVVESDFCPTLKSSGGTDIRKMPKIHYKDWTASQDNRAHLDTGIAPALGSSNGASMPKVEVGVHQIKLGKSKDFKREKVDTDAYCLDTNWQDGIVLNGNIRRLTEIECERLQGFPDDWTKYGNYDGVIKEIPKTQRYKLCGNAVTVDIVEMIAKKLLQ